MYTYFQFENHQTVESVKHMLRKCVFKPIEEAIEAYLEDPCKHPITDLIYALKTWGSEGLLCIQTTNSKSEQMLKSTKYQQYFQRKVVEIQRLITNLSLNISPQQDEKLASLVQTLDTAEFNFLVLDGNYPRLPMKTISSLSDLLGLAKYKNKARELDINPDVRNFMIQEFFLNNIYFKENLQIIFVEKFFFSYTSKTSLKKLWECLGQKRSTEKVDLCIDVHLSSAYLHNDKVVQVDKGYVLNRLNRRFKQSIAQDLLARFSSLTLNVFIYEYGDFNKKFHDRYLQFSSGGEKAKDTYFWGQGIQSWNSTSACLFGMVRTSKYVDGMLDALKDKSLKEAISYEVDPNTKKWIVV